MADGWQHVSSFDGTRVAWRLDAPSETLTKAGKVRASETAVVLCNGISCDHGYWNHVWGPLAERAPVLRWHYRGHGDSDPPADPDAYRVVDVVRDLEAVTRESGVKRAVLVGHSYGVQVVTETPRHLPDLAAGMVCVAGTYGHPIMRFGPFNPGVRVFDVFHATTKLPVLPELTRAVMRSPLAYWGVRAIRLIGPHAPRDDMRQWFDHLARLDMGVITRMLRGMQEHTSEDLHEHYDVPVVTIPGGSDWATPTRILRRLAERAPHGRMVEVTDASHVLPIEHPEVVVEEVLRVLDEAG